MEKRELIYGSTGYTILYNKSLDCEILLLSDNHDEKIKQCNPNKKDDIQINDYLKGLLDKNYIIMVEEVPFRADKTTLIGLWDNSDHVKNVRNFYENNIANKNLIPFDIRFELIDSFDPIDYNVLTLKNYIKNIYKFFMLEHDFFNDLILYSKKIDDSVIKRYYIKLMIKFLNFCERNKIYLNNIIKSIENKDILIEKIQDLVSDIMEFYILIKLYDLVKLNKKIVIYSGLFHIHNIEVLLIKYYNFIMIEQYGKMNMEEKDDNQCIIKPNF